MSAATMARRPHLLIMPCPVQGHVAPLMKLAHLIAGHGIKVTFLNSESIHAKLRASQSHQSEVGSLIELASIPDWLGPRHDRNEIPKAVESNKRVMPGHLKDFIERVNGTSNEDEQITCVVADIFYGRWPMQVANEMGIQGIPFCPLGPGPLALVLHIPKLIEARILRDTDGSPLSDELVFVSKDIPVPRRDRLPWSWPSDFKVQEAIFGVYLTFNQIILHSEWLLLNCPYELDTAAFDVVPNILPIGPLLASSHPGHSSGSFWPEDSTCISWLDDQPPGSVIYVAFGSSTIFTQHQFNELALAIELVGRPFLWVVRSDFTIESAVQYPDGFIERVTAGHGKIVSWAPQERVLAHPSVACFLSHCGWNSTMDGIVAGVPFLCWPYYTDQFYNESTICDKWKVGLRLNSDENGLVSRHEIKRKVEELISDYGIKENVDRSKDIARKSGSEGGSSYNNLKTFIEAMNSKAAGKN